MSMFGQVVGKLRRRSRGSERQRMTLNLSKGNFTERARGARMGPDFIKRRKDIELLWDEEAFEEGVGEGWGEVRSVRLSRIEVCLGQRWVLRIKFQYRVVLAGGETVVQEVAAPTDEVKATKYINGKLSSKICSMDLEDGEFLVAGEEGGGRATSEATSEATINRVIM